MDAIAMTFGVVWTSVGLLCMVLAVPLVRGQVRPNALYGFRLPQSFRSEEAWYAINRFGGRKLFIWSPVLIALGLVSFFMPFRSHPALIVILACTALVSILTPLLITVRFAIRFDAKR